MKQTLCQELYTRYESKHEYSISPFWMEYETFEKIFNCYSQPHRFFHTINHITYLWDKIDGMNDVNECWKPILYVMALLHDVVYDPTKNDNEEQSVNYYKSVFSKRKFKDDKQNYDMVIDAIRATKDHLKSNNSIIQRFLDADMSSLYINKNLIETEMQIFKEFQYVTFRKFKDGRINFLKTAYKKPMEDSEKFAIDMRIQFWNEYKPRIGIMLGSFNRFHNGHLNILEKAEKMFDKVIVVCGSNPEKEPNPNILADVKSALPFHEVISWDKTAIELLNQYRHQFGITPTLIKGFRTDQDIPYEMNLYKYMQDQDKDFSVIYIPCDREFEHLSSSSLKAVAAFKVDTEKYYPTKYQYKQGLK